MSRGSTADYDPAQSRLVLFGLDNQTTREVLQGLLAHGVRPLAVVLPGSAAPHLIAEGAPVAIVPPVDRSLSVLAPAQRDHIAEQVWAAGLPLMVVGDLGADETVRALAGLRAEVGVVACFSRKIPQPVRDLFAAGVLNIHPSLLPDYRGPAPLFWQLRDGKTLLGVTLHQMDGGFDTGPIVGQTAVRFAAGTPEPIAELVLAQTGVLLLVDALAELQRGALVAVPQPPGGSVQGWPTDDDFAIGSTWTVARAHSFVQSTATWGRPYRIVVDGEMVEFANVLALAPTVLTDRIVYESEQAAWIPMRDGALRVRLVAAEGNPA